MSSPQTRGSGHLEFREGQDIAYCHICRHEWYREGNTQELKCPRCQGEIVEIVERNNDPRVEDDAPFRLGPRPRFPSHDSDSDPEEEDIEHHFGWSTAGPYTRRASGGGGSASSRFEQGPNGDAILRRFTEMLVNDFRAQPPHGGARDELFPNGATTRVRTTTFTSPFRGGTTTFTIATGPIHGGLGTEGPAPPFGMLFGNLMGPDLEPPGRAGPGGGTGPGNVGGGGPPGGNLNIAASLQEILQALINPAAAVHGDAVYSQEALDRIITRLMEANPQSNAAPPASEAAISRLEKKIVDDELLGSEGKAECTICIDEINRGDEVLMLPCKHWFHGHCVTLWLKEHNTCPICRTPIEAGNGNSNSAAGPSRQTNSRPARPAPFPTSASSSRQERPLRSMRENEERLNAIRNLAELRNTTTPPSSDRTAGNRRNSLSPPITHRIHSASELASRVRVRSPSHSRDRDQDRDRGSGQSGGNGSSRQREGSSTSGGNGGHSGGGGGPLGWLRSTFGRHRDSSDGGDHHQQDQQRRRPSGNS